MKKLVIMVTVVMMCSSLLVWSGSKGETTSKDGKEMIELVFATNETPILTKDFWEIPINSFMAANTHITITNVAQPSSSVPMMDYLKTQLATGEFPDVMVMMTPKDFVNEGVLMAIPVDSLTYINATDLPGGQIGGNQYVVPYKKQAVGMFYNKDIFAQYGLEEPQTFDELIAICKTLEDAGVVPLGVGIKDGWPQNLLATSMLTAEILGNDPDWMEKRNKDQVKFTDKEFVDVLTDYQMLVTEYTNTDRASVSYAQMLESFFGGGSAMMAMGTWAQGEAERLQPDFNVGFFPLPSNTNGNGLPVLVNEGLSINVDTEYPEEAIAFVEHFMTNQDWYSQFLKTEMLFETTAQAVDYEKSPVRMDLGERMANPATVQLEHIIDMSDESAMLPGLQSLFGAATLNIALGSDVTKEMEILDQEWEMANANLQN